MGFNGLRMHLGNLPLLSARSRALSRGKPDGQKGMGAMAQAESKGRGEGIGTPVANAVPARSIAPGERRCSRTWTAWARDPEHVVRGILGRDFILRIYWDGAEKPAVECPLPDFFGLHWVRKARRAARNRRCD